MLRRLALAVVCLATLSPALLRALASAPASVATCSPAGKGEPPRHWIGCAGDPGPRRDLTGTECLMAGVAIDLNGATPEDLAVVPGLSARLAIEVVRDRAIGGAFRSVDDLVRVRGIGPGRLARARPFLAIRR